VLLLLTCLLPVFNQIFFGEKIMKTTMKTTQALLTAVMVSGVVMNHPLSASAEQNFQYAITPTKT
jgi:hypothetical protein